MSFSIGDVVRLKSGGPAMTVGATRNDAVACYWNRDNNEPLGAQFPTDALVLAPAPPQDAGEIYLTIAMVKAAFDEAKLAGLDIGGGIIARLYRAMERARKKIT